MPSLRGSRPKSPDRPPTRNDDGLIIPSRTSSLHSRIAQPLPSALSMKTGLRAPKTLTHAYMVCGVGREPSQWVKAPQPVQGKIQHMKGAVGQFWLPEILGSSPRLEQDNEIARSLHAAVRVSSLNISRRHLRNTKYVAYTTCTNILHRHVSLTMSRSALARVSHTVSTTRLSYSKIRRIHFTVLLYESGRALTRSVPRRYAR
jgi:hypothetical protein